MCRPTLLINGIRIRSIVTVFKTRDVFQFSFDDHDCLGIDSGAHDPKKGIFSMLAFPEWNIENVQLGNRPIEQPYVIIDASRQRTNPVKSFRKSEIECQTFAGAHCGSCNVGFTLESAVGVVFIHFELTTFGVATTYASWTLKFFNHFNICHLTPTSKLLRFFGTCCLHRNCDKREDHFWSHLLYR